MQQNLPENSLKGLLSEKSIQILSKLTKKHCPLFKETEFEQLVKKDFETLSLMQRVSRIGSALNKAIPLDFNDKILVFNKIAPELKGAFLSMTLPDAISQEYFMHVNEALTALEYLTQFSTSEFAMRTLLTNHLELSLEKAIHWSKSENVHVRRLASECTRPRLPWGKKLHAIEKNPNLTKDILETLKADESLYVRKSVANHLNDITKNNPDWVIDLVKEWDLNNDKTKWIVKHALRSLIKAGNSRALTLLGVNQNPLISVNPMPQDKKIELGQNLSFSTEIVSNAQSDQTIVVDYAVYYIKKNNKIIKKIFKGKSFVLKSKQTFLFHKSHRFEDLSTRKHYPGMHKIEVLINGNVAYEFSVELIC